MKRSESKEEHEFNKEQKGQIQRAKVSSAPSVSSSCCRLCFSRSRKVLTVAVAAACRSFSSGNDIYQTNSAFKQSPHKTAYIRGGKKHQAVGLPTIPCSTESDPSSKPSAPQLQLWKLPLGSEIDCEKAANADSKARDRQ